MLRIKPRFPPAAQPQFNGSCTGQANDIASFLFNVPSSVGQDTNSTFPAYRQTWLFFFVSDKWQVNSKLTLDIGARYELYPPATPRKAGGFVNYNPATNQLVMAGVGGNPSNLGMQTDYQQHSRRVSERPIASTRRLVVRAGIGVSYVPFLDNNYAYNYPIKTSTNYNPVATYGPTINPGGRCRQPRLPVFLPLPPSPSHRTEPSPRRPQTDTLGLGNLYIPLNFKEPYVTSWNVALQQALPKEMSLQIAYVANHGTDISIEQNINLPRIYGQSATYDPLNHAADGSTPTFGKTASVTEFSLGYSSNFQSLQVQLKKRFAHGIGFTSGFTWGKAQGLRDRSPGWRALLLGRSRQSQLWLA